jgi:hypothetical protein
MVKNILAVIGGLYLALLLIGLIAAGGYNAAKK